MPGIDDIALVETAPSASAAEHLLAESGLSHGPDDGTTKTFELTSPSSEAIPAVQDAPEKKKRGRKPKAGARTPSGRLSEAGKPRKTFGREEARQVDAGPVAAAAETGAVLSGDVKDGPVPPLDVPDPALLDFVKPYGVKFVGIVARMAARIAKNDKLAMLPQEQIDIGECLAVVVILRMPAVALRAPEMALLAAIIAYGDRVKNGDAATP